MPICVSWVHQSLIYYLSMNFIINSSIWWNNLCITLIAVTSLHPSLKLLQPLCFFPDHIYLFTDQFHPVAHIIYHFINHIHPSANHRFPLKLWTHFLQLFVQFWLLTLSFICHSFYHCVLFYHHIDISVTPIYNGLCSTFANPRNVSCKIYHFNSIEKLILVCNKLFRCCRQLMSLRAKDTFVWRN